MKKEFLLIFLFIISFLGYGQRKYGKVVISEVYFDTHYIEDQSYLNHHAGEFIELYNSSDQDIDISDWRIIDNVSGFEIPSGTIIKSGGFKVITFTSSKDKFIELFPEAAGHEDDIILQDEFILNNNVEKIYLMSHAGLESNFSYYPVGWTVINTLNAKIQNAVSNYDINLVYGFRELDNGENLSLSGAIPDNAKAGIRLASVDAFYKNGGNPYHIEKGIVKPFDLHLTVPLLPLFIDIPPNLSSSENYIYQITYTYPFETSELGEVGSNDKIETVSYFDGLGRSKQEIAIRSSPNYRDIVTHFEYDNMGRQVKEFLSFENDVHTIGNIKTGDVALKTKSFYKNAYENDFTGIPINNVNAYSERKFDNSPFSRVMKEASPGAVWEMDSGHEIKYGYDTNIVGEVKVFSVNLDSEYRPTLMGGALFYNHGELYKSIIKDENWTPSDGKNNTTEDFTDKMGRVLLKRTYADIDFNNDGDTNDSGEQEIAHDTYYVYDTFGNLTFVIPPKATDMTINPTVLDNLCFQYKYDHLKRVTEKKLPGKGREYIVYDALNRPVLTQDAKQRLNNQWLFTKYDVHRRGIYSGIYTHTISLSQKQMQDYFNSQNPSYESKVTSGTGYANTYYTNNSFPNTNIEMLTINYYDNYSFDLAGSTDPKNTYMNVYGRQISKDVKSLQTGTRIKVLGSNPEKWITSITYYDEKAKIIYTYNNNAFHESTDIVEHKVDFIGNVLEKKETHKKVGKEDIIIVDRFEFDHQHRLISQKQSVNNSVEEIIVENTLDGLGKIQSKKVGGKINQPRLQTINYKSNVRGWLTDINNDTYTDNDLFNFSIKYHDPSSGNPLYNGNISQTSWNSLSPNPGGNLISTQYTYEYDALYRIRSAMDNTGRYDVFAIAYDKNGNISRLKRRGNQIRGTNNFGLMDNLTYWYHDDTNKLRKVEDPTGYDEGFKNGTDQYVEYTYDVNGNMIRDDNKGITDISYNHLNLPTQVVIGQNKIEYTYDASGIKIEKKVIEISGFGTNIITNTTTTAYAGNYVYKKSKTLDGSTGYGNTIDHGLQFFNQAEGYVKVDEYGSPGYVYQYKDHLGNIRLSYTDTDGDGAIDPLTEIIEENNYYPFGLKHRGYNYVTSPNGNSTAQKFGYLGQELNEELGLNWHSYKWRNADPALGRFFSVDPISEDYMSISTYQFAHNNPIWKIEVEGLEGLETFGEDIPNAEPVRGYTNAARMAMPIPRRTYGVNVNKNYLSPINNYNSKSYIVYTWKSKNLKGNNVFGKPRNANCANLACAQANEMGTKLEGQGKTGEVTYTNRIGVYNGKKDKKLNGKEAIKYINDQLEKGLVVVVGIDYTKDKKGTDDLGTDHYVTIVGRDSDEKGNGFFIFIENATGNKKKATNFKKNRLYVNTGKSGLSGTSAQITRGLETTRVQKNEKN
ncbi:MAG: lamin tail domain-containing protein [Flavobacteriaceae bacterium]